MTEKDEMLREFMTTFETSGMEDGLTSNSGIIDLQRVSIKKFVDIAFVDLFRPGAKAEMTRMIEHLRVLGERIEREGKNSIPPPMFDPRVGSDIFRR